MSTAIGPTMAIGPPVTIGGFEGPLFDWAIVNPKIVWTATHPTRAAQSRRIIWRKKSMKSPTRPNVRAGPARDGTSELKNDNGPRRLSIDDATRGPSGYPNQDGTVVSRRIKQVAATPAAHPMSTSRPTSGSRHEPRRTRVHDTSI